MHIFTTDEQASCEIFTMFNEGVRAFQFFGYIFNFLVMASRNSHHIDQVSNKISEYYIPCCSTLNYVLIQNCMQEFIMKKGT